MKRILLSLIAGMLLAPVASSAQDAASPRFKMASNALVLAPGETSGTFTVTVFATFQNADKRPKTDATLTDETPNATSATVKPASVKTTGELQQIWRFTVAVSGFPKGATQSRTFLLSYATFREKLDYSVTNANSIAFAWSVKAAPEWNVATQQAYAIDIRVGDVPATNVRHSVSLISDDKLKETAGDAHFELCANAEGDCSPVRSSLEPRITHKLYIRPARALPIGTLKGKISIGAAEKTDPDVVEVTVYSRRPEGRRWGVVALAMGVFLSLLAQVFIPHLMQRGQERAAVQLLAKRLAVIRAEFNRLDEKVRKKADAWNERANQLEEEISDLDDLVRGLVPAAFVQEVASVETLKAGIERTGATLSLLQLLQREGIERIVDLMKSFQGHDDEGLEAAAKIAVVSAGDSAADDVKAIVDDFKAAASGEPKITPLAAAPRSAARAFNKLRMQILALSLAAWFLWALFSILTGAVLLVFKNPGFGTWLDYVFCVAWGAGITLAGQQAAQMTPGSVATALGIKIPAASGK